MDRPTKSPRRASERPDERETERALSNRARIERLFKHGDAYLRRAEEFAPDMMREA